MMKKRIVKVKVIEGFALPAQGYYQEGEEITLHFGRNQSIGVLTPERYGKLLAKGKIEPVERKVSDGKV